MQRQENHQVQTQEKIAYVSIATDKIDLWMVWRWNLLSWLMVGGYVLVLFALPDSRGLK